MGVKERFAQWLAVVMLTWSMLSGEAVAAGDPSAEGQQLAADDSFQDLLADETEWDDEISDFGVYDPLEPWNRVVFEFNDRLYFWVLKPVKQGYSAVLPDDIRMVIGNFFNNLSAPIRLVNAILQGRFNDAGIVFSRFFINTTLGVYGFGDVAGDELGLEPQRADFGQTLGVYGVGEGVYLCWPLLGPSNVRDTFGFIGDFSLSPLQYADLDMATNASIRSTELINRMSVSPDLYEELKRISLDPYVASREAYHEYRRGLIELERQKDNDEQ